MAVIGRQSVLVDCTLPESSYLCIRESELTEIEHMSNRFEYFIHIGRSGKRSCRSSNSNVIGNTQAPLSNRSLDARFKFVNLVISQMTHTDHDCHSDYKHGEAGHL